LILIVDDDPDIATLIRISLEKRGFSVSCFTDPVTALDEFRLHSAEYDLIISDIRMPHLNGYQLVQQAKKIKPDITILIMSAFEFDLDLPDDFSRSDVDEFVKKPIAMERLNKIVFAHIHQLR